LANFTRKLALLALGAAAACNDSPPSAPPPTDRFYYPTGLAIRHLAPAGATDCVAGSAGCRTQLIVASSNFDLRYDVANGGTVISVDVDETLAQRAPGKGTPIPLVNPKAVRVGSFGGELAIADPATCPELGGGPQALVTSRSEGALYRLDLDATGVSCPQGSECKVQLETTLDDPYSVTLACGTFPAQAGAQPQPQAYAFIGYLRTLAALGVLTRFDLNDASGTPSTHIDVSAGTAASAAFDAVARRLYVTSRFIGVGASPLRWLDLAAPGQGATVVDLDAQIRGTEMRGMALSTPDPADPARHRRGYLPLRLYDFDLAATIGRPPTDVGAALAVLDLSDPPGLPAAVKVLRVVPLERGANEVRVIPRAAKRDLVAVTSSDEGTLTLYDDDTGSVARVFGLCGARDASPGADPATDPSPCRSEDAGKPALGQQPFGLAVEPFTPADAAVPLVRLYVGSFDRSWVNVIEIDPLHPDARAAGGRTLRWDRIGSERQ
jgi:hypothetical protein